MQAGQSIQIQVHLTLTQEEAEWLNNVMRNPLSEDPDPTKEDPVHKEMRMKFFQATLIRT